MNAAMKKAWVEITPMLGDLTNEELTVFLHTWQRAMQAEREACAKVCDELHPGLATKRAAEIIRARGQA